MEGFQVDEASSSSKSAQQVINIPLGINLLDEFDTYEEFDDLLKEVSRQHYVHFWKRDCRTVTRAKKKTDRYLDPKIKYYQLKYSCIHGGPMFKRKNIDARIECEANVYLTATSQGNKLYVKSLNNNHNHEVSESAYLKYFTEEKTKRGRKNKIYPVKLETDYSSTCKNLGQYQADSLSDDTNMKVESSIDKHVPNSPQDNHVFVQYDFNLYKNDAESTRDFNDNGTEIFLKYLASEMQQIRNTEVLKSLKRRIITLVQQAQDEEYSN